MTWYLILVVNYSKISLHRASEKALLFALKLAEMDVLKENKGFAPLLLLDDVFEKLDEDRIANLLRRVCIENNGQVFITDTNQERLSQHLNVIINKLPVNSLELKVQSPDITFNFLPIAIGITFNFVPWVNIQSVTLLISFWNKAASGVLYRLCNWRCVGRYHG
jgi:hypothetical protein